MTDLYETFLQAEIAWKLSQDMPHTFLDSDADHRLRLFEAKQTALAAWLNEPSPFPIEAGETDLDPQEFQTPVDPALELERLMFGAPIAAHRMTPYVTLSNTSMGW